MITDRELSAAILARKPEAASRIEIEHDDRNLFGKPWGVALFFDGDCVTENGETLSIALNKAEVSMRRKRAENTRRAGVALAYSADWTGQPDARVFANATERN